MNMSHRVRRFLLFIFIIILGGSVLAFVPHQSETKKAAVVFLKHVPPYCPDPADCEPWWTPADLALILPPRHSASVYQFVLNSFVTSYYNRNSFNQVHLEFTSIVNPNSGDGWFDAPHKIYQYNLGEANLHRDGVDVAYGAIGNALNDYDYLIIVHNYHGRSGQACNVQGPPNFGPAECSYPVGSTTVSLGDLYVAENSSDELFAAITSHELGHLLGVPDQYSGYTGTWPAMGPWDLMADDAYFNHFGAWSKWNRGWIPTVTTMPCIEGPCQVTTTLQSLEIGGNNVLKIPFITAPFTGYMVECRNRYNGDNNIPEQGVLITSIDTSRPVGSSLAQVVSPTGDNDFSTAALVPGEVFADEARKITVTYLSQEDGYKCKVKAERGEIHAPDPSIILSTGEELGTGDTKYKSRDIWIDSQMNGWDVYPMTESMIMEDGIGSPYGYGDPIWVGHENRIKFKIRNTGYSSAEQVMVDVYVTQPLRVEIPGLTCMGSRTGSAKLIGTVTIDHLAKGEVYYGYVPWTPTSNSTAQVTVQIRDYSGEVTHSNNISYETYMPNYVVAESGFSDLSNKVLKKVDIIYVEPTENCSDVIPFRFQRVEVKAIVKKDWVVQFEPESGMMGPGEEEQVQLISIPPSDAKPGDCADLSFELTALVGDVFMPVSGFSTRSCVVQPSTLTCNSKVQRGSISLGGELNPTNRPVPIALEFISPSGLTSTRNMTTNRMGTYQDIFIPNEKGIWKFQGFWQGDDRTSPAQSDVCSFTIEKLTPQFVLDQNSNCRNGPGKDYRVITSWKKGDILEIEARSPDSLWLFGQRLKTKCWVALALGSLNVDVEDLAVRIPPAIPTQAASCASYTTQSVCNRYQDVCKWVEPAGTVAGMGKCVNK